ncbi:MAG: winged helix-turn-helix domain-containing protein [Vicinamibacterales bacterium]
MHFYEFGAYRLEVEERRLTGHDGVPVVLPPKVFDTLVLLVEAGGRLVTREDFQARLWADTVVEERNLTVNISTLRKALNRDADDYIETVPRAGYRLNVPVRQAAGAFPDEPAATVPPVIADERPSRLEAPAARAIWPLSPRAAFVIGALTMLVSMGVYVASDATSGPAATASATSTLAVLPFSAIGTAPDDGRLGLGLADAVIARLGQVPELTVRPTSTIKMYTAGGNLIEIGRALDVAHVVEGVVRADGDRAKVIVKVVDVASGATRWQDVFDRPFSDLFDLQEAVSAGVATSLVRRLAVERSWGTPTRRPSNDAAYRAYLDGKAFMQGNVDLDVSGAIVSFQRAVALDPNFAPAWTGLARAYRSRGYSLGGNPHEFKDLAREAVRRALAIDPDLPEAHTVLGILHFSYDWDWDAALRELRRAVELAPRSHDAQGWLGYALYTLGNYEEGLATLQRAAVLNPMEPKTQIAEALWFMGRIDEALGMLEETTRLHPMHERSHWLRVFILDQAGRFAEAVTARRAAANAIGDTAYLNELDESVKGGPRAVLEQDLRLRQARRNLSDVAWLHVQLNQPELALDALEACADQLCNAIGLLRTEARFRSLHEHPRYQALLRRTRLVPAG